MKKHGNAIRIAAMMVMVLLMAVIAAPGMTAGIPGNPAEKNESVSGDTFEEQVTPDDDSLPNFETNPLKDDKTDPPKDEKTDPPKDDKTDPPKDDKTDPPKDEKTDPPKDKKTRAPETTTSHVPFVNRSVAPAPKVSGATPAPTPEPQPPRITDNNTIYVFLGQGDNKAVFHVTGIAGEQIMLTIMDENDEIMDRITESTKATLGFFGENVAFINVMRNMSVSCDCEGTAAEPVVTPDVGILASLDILAVDQACMDLVYSLPEHASSALRERVETRHGHRQLSYMKEMEMGNNRYKLIDIDNGDIEITQKEAVAHAGDTWIPDSYNTFPQRAK